MPTLLFLVYKEKDMKCVICKNGETADGFATVTLERDGLTLVMKKVPASVCQNCGEEYVDEEIAAQLFNTMAEASKSGAEVEIRRFLKAA